MIPLSIYKLSHRELKTEFNSVNFNNQFQFNPQKFHLRDKLTKALSSIHTWQELKVSEHENCVHYRCMLQLPSKDKLQASYGPK